MLADDPSTDERLTAMSPQRMMTSTVDTRSTRQPTSIADATGDAPGDIAASLIYHSSDFAVSPISDATKVQHCCDTFYVAAVN